MKTEISFNRQSSFLVQSTIRWAYSPQHFTHSSDYLTKLLGITDETMPFKCIEDKKIKGEKGQREKRKTKKKEEIWK